MNHWANFYDLIGWVVSLLLLLLCFLILEYEGGLCPQVLVSCFSNQVVCGQELLLVVNCWSLVVYRRQSHCGGGLADFVVAQDLYSWYYWVLDLVLHSVSGLLQSQMLEEADPSMGCKDASMYGLCHQN